MSYKQLFIWVEGIDDERFVEKILKPLFSTTYNQIKIIKYAGLKKEKINNFIISINAMNSDYIFLGDIDNSTCIRTKKTILSEKFNKLDINNIIIVIKEIESWYLAGLDDDTCSQFNLSNFSNTNNLIKEQFNQIIPRKYDSRIDFMNDILKCFSLQIAKLKNTSFNYFLQKYSIN